MNELKWIKMPEKWFRLESEFTTYWLGELKKKWYWKKKWSDASQDLKPYDCNIRTNIESYFCEVKIIEKDEFSFSQFRQNQIKALDDISKLWWKAIVVIYSILYNNYVVEDFAELKKKYNK
jgi:hypothetical protein